MILLVVRPMIGQYSLRRHIIATDHILDLTFLRDPERTPINGMVGQHFDVHHRGPQISQLKVPEFLPVDHIGVQVKAQSGDHVLNILDRKFTVPPIVEVNTEGTEAQLMRHVRNVTAVHTAAYSDQAIIRLTGSFFLHFTDSIRQHPLSLLAFAHKSALVRLKPSTMLA